MSENETTDPEADEMLADEASMAESLGSALDQTLEPETDGPELDEEEQPESEADEPKPLERPDDWPEGMPFTQPGGKLGPREAAYRRRRQRAAAGPELRDALTDCMGVARTLPQPQRGMIMDMIEQLRAAREDLARREAELQARED
jgi:hypothetical protein